MITNYSASDLRVDTCCANRHLPCSLAPCTASVLGTVITVDEVLISHLAAAPATLRAPRALLTVLDLAEAGTASTGIDGNGDKHGAFAVAGRTDTGAGTVRTDRYIISCHASLTQQRGPAS